MSSLLPRDTFLTASNVISLVRGAMTIPIIVALLSHSRWLALALCVVAAATDWLDGYIARRTETVSEWGKVLDPVADKILVGGVVVVLTVQGILPPWFVTAIILRDVVILIGAWYAKRRSAVVLPSLMSGKLAVSAIALAGAVSIACGEPSYELIIVSCCVMAVSLVQYATRLYGLLR